MIYRMKWRLLLRRSLWYIYISFFNQLGPSSISIYLHGNASLHFHIELKVYDFTRKLPFTRSARDILFPSCSSQEVTLRWVFLYLPLVDALFSSVVTVGRLNNIIFFYKNLNLEYFLKNQWENNVTNLHTQIFSCILR